MKRVKVFNENGEVVALVGYNQNLDYWDGRNFTNGGTGKHKGLTKLRDGSFVLIYGTNWQDERDYAEIINEEDAFQWIVKSGAFELFDDHRFSRLKAQYEAMTNLEEDEEE